MKDSSRGNTVRKPKVSIKSQNPVSERQHVFEKIELISLRRQRKITFMNKTTRTDGGIQKRT